MAVSTYIVFFPLALLGLVLMPFVAIGEFFVRNRSLLSSARAAVISAIHSSLLFMPYLIIKTGKYGNLKLRRLLFYIYIHLFWLFGSGLVWIYNLANTKFVYYSSEISLYPQRPYEAVQTLLAIVVLSITCCYSLVYLWRAHRAGIIHGFSILPLVFAMIWLLIGLLDYISIEEVSGNPGFIERTRESYESYVYYRGTASYYEWAIPLTLASFAWIAYTWIKLRRARPGSNPPSASGPEAGTPASSGSSTSDPPTPRSTPPDAGLGAS